MALLTSLRYRSFAFLWAGQTISRLGDAIYSVALGWWVLQQTHSATAMGLVLLTAFLPTLVFILIGGVIADRIPRLTIMLISDLARGVLTGLLTLFAMHGSLPVSTILAISFCFGLLDAFFLPAYSAVVPQLLPKEALPAGNGLRIISSRTMGIIGPALGAALIAFGGIPLAFGINALSFFISALCLITVMPAVRSHNLVARTPEKLPEQSQRWRRLWPQFRQDFIEGLTTVRVYPWIWLTILIALPVNVLAAGATDVAIPFYVQHTLHSPLVYGGLTAAGAIGTIVAAVWYGTRTHRRRGWIIYGFFLLNVLVLIPMGAWPVPVVLLGGMFLYSFCADVLGLAWVNALQEYVPNEQMGRISSIDQLGSYLGIPLSYACAGPLVDLIGVRPLLIWGGLIAALTVGLGLLSRSVRTLD